MNPQTALALWRESEEPHCEECARLLSDHEETLCHDCQVERDNAPDPEMVGWLVRSRDGKIYESIQSLADALNVNINTLREGGEFDVISDSPLRP